MLLPFRLVPLLFLVIMHSTGSLKLPKLQSTLSNIKKTSTLYGLLMLSYVSMSYNDIHWRLNIFELRSIYVILPNFHCKLIRIPFS